MPIKVVEINCPKCGASAAIDMPHGLRACKFCGTQYAVIRNVETAPAEPPVDPDHERQSRNLMVAIVIACIFGGLLLALALAAATMIKGVEAPSTNKHPFYNVPRR